MAEKKKNIIVLGGSFAGLSAAHYFLKHVSPSLPDPLDYHLSIVNPSKDFMFRIAAPRAISCPDLMPTSKFFFPIADAFKQYDSQLYTIIQGKATALDTAARTVTIQVGDSTVSTQQILYHALVIATGSRTTSALFSIDSGRQQVEAAFKDIHQRLQQAKTILIAGGGPTGVETAGEIGESLNGKACSFSSRLKNPKVQITLLSGSNKILPGLRTSIADQAESYLGKVGVEVIHNKRAVSSKDNGDGTTTVTLDNGEIIRSDIYIEAVGVIPNTEWLEDSLLNETGHVKTNKASLRVDDAGPRVYALGDVGSYTRGGVMDMYDAVPVALCNMRKDLIAAGSTNRSVAESTDRVYAPNLAENQLVPIGRSRGVGAFKGWWLSSFIVWFFKGRDYLIGTVAVEMYSGSKWDKAS